MAAIDIARHGRIPEEVLRAARLRMKRRIAAAIILAMADEGVSFADIDARLGRDRPWARRTLLRYIDGKTRDFDGVSDLCVAMGRDMDFALSTLAWRVDHDIPSASPSPDTGSSGTTEDSQIAGGER